MHDLIVVAANRYKIPVPLVLAIVDQESSFDPWAVNPEPRYRYLWDVEFNKPFRKLTAEEDASEIPPLDFHAYSGVPRDAEWWGQQASWGLMQVMGAVAREHGFMGRFLSQLCDPEVGLEIGCRHFAASLKRFKEPYPALEAWNGGPGAVGRNAKYANAVISKIAQYAA